MKTDYERRAQRFPFQMKQVSCSYQNDARIRDRDSSPEEGNRYLCVLRGSLSVLVEHF